MNAELVTLSNLVTAGLAEPQSHDAKMLGYAIAYADAGWKIFPLSRKKRPRIRSPHPKGFRCKGECGQFGHGVWDATDDIATVCQWWAIDYPGSSIAAAVPKGMFVLDTDPRKPGYLAVTDLLAPYGPLPRTLTHLSGRLDGGCHRFYWAPPGELAGALLVPGIEEIPIDERGVDIKAAGGYVVMPPTPHPDTGHPYLAIDAPIVGAGWLGRFVTKPARKCRATYTAQQRRFWTSRPDGPSPADWFTDNHSWAEVLMPAGWAVVGGGDGEDDGDRWVHPTHTSGCSATIRNGQLFVYSTSTAFEPTNASSPRGYTKFRAYAVLNFNGDLSAAAKSLRKEVT